MKGSGLHFICLPDRFIETDDRVVTFGLRDRFGARNLSHVRVSESKAHIVRCVQKEPLDADSDADWGRFGSEVVVPIADGDPYGGDAKVPVPGRQPRRRPAPDRGSQGYRTWACRCS